MTNADHPGVYRNYIACLNGQDWENLGQFVHEDLRYNDEAIGLTGYREMRTLRETQRGLRQAGEAGPGPGSDG